MHQFDFRKYKAAPPIQKRDRRWPDQVITEAPQWCSVDLRDGNQALIEPMSVAQKKQMFSVLVKTGFKQIEVGFPAASQTDFDFVRALIEENIIPDDVTIQVLTQAREELIVRSFEALRGAKRAIMHVYNSTSTVQREKVFGLDKDGIKNIAIDGARIVKQEAKKFPEIQWAFQYSPESFTGTEIDYAVEVCNAVIDVWQPTASNKAIINLPATVEMTTPNVYADQIEWFCDHINSRDAVIVSLHTHNDRGCAIAAAELAVMAGADRVEGTLLGNGERTGNMDIVTMAMNMYSQGIDPALDFSNMDEIIQCITQCTQLPVHPRHPYAGELVFTAFSGSHQDAINKCLTKQSENSTWDVAYLPIDPSDLGRNYQEVIRINSQSGKGGIAYVLEQDHGIQMPRWMQIDFSAVVQAATESSETEICSDQIWQLFQDHYMNPASDTSLDQFELTRENNQDTLTAHIKSGTNSVEISGVGAGVIEAFTNAIQHHSGQQIVVVDYNEHALTHATNAEAIAYINLNIDGERVCGAAMSKDIVAASLNAILSAMNQASINPISLAA